MSAARSPWSAIYRVIASWYVVGRRSKRLISCVGALRN